MKRSIRVIWLAVWAVGFLGTSNGIFGQSIPEKTPAEQITAEGVASQIQSFGGQGSYSVSSGGDLGLGVPLMTVSGRKLSLPLRLGYSPGIKVEQKAGPVGLGWGIGFGSIVRDFGDLDPDYTTPTRDESGGKNAAGGLSQLATPSSQTQLNHLLHNQRRDYDGMLPGQFIPDDYHVSAPGLGGNTFWNDNGSERFAWASHSNWRIEYTEKDYNFQQEMSRVNELSLGYNVNYDPDQGSHASAIGMYDIAANARTQYTCYPNGNGNGVIALGNTASDVFLWNDVQPNLAVEYRDFGSFTITNEQGTQYVFGKALRGQKYLFKEDPYWSASSQSQGTEAFNGNNPIYGNTSIKGEFWKTDYIAEWVLTEVRSQDYVDINQTGVADEGDYGDWIRIEYLEGMETIPIPDLLHGGGYQVPFYREYLNFSQTDPTSALWRERAYVSRIVTPVQELVVGTQAQFDVDHDYFSKTANGRHQGHASFDQYYAPNLQKYTEFSLFDRITGKRVQKSELLYAAQGSGEQLAKSSYLIRKNDDTEANYSQADEFAPYQNGVRGKTTLLGVKSYGTTNADPQTHRFEYGYNPDYTDIHRAKVWADLYYPNKRESRTAIHLLNPNYTQLLPTPQSGLSENLYMAYASWPYAQMVDGMGTNLNPSLSHNGIPIVQRLDQMGHYYDEYAPLQGRHAWSLTKVIYPTGGSLEIDYERDEINYSADRALWSLKDDQLPNVQSAFNLFVGRQAALQQSQICSKPGPLCTHASYYMMPQGPNGCKFTTPEFHYPLDGYTGGLRVSEVRLDDGIGTRYTTGYSYGGGNTGKGHLAETNSTYWGMFMSAFSKHIRVNRAKETDEQYRLVTIQSIDGFGQYTNDFDFFDYLFYSTVRMDIRSESKVIYPVVQTNQTDGASIRQHYRSRPLNNAYMEVRPLKNLGNLRKDVWMITGNKTYGTGDLTKQEYFKAGENTPYASEEYVYTHFTENQRDLTYRNWAIGPGQDYPDSYLVPYYTWAEKDLFNFPGNTNEGWVIANPGNYVNSAAQVIDYVNSFGLAPLNNCNGFFQNADPGILYGMFQPQPQRSFTRQHTVARVLLQETANYQGLSTLTQHAYETDHYLRTMTTVYNSTPQSGGAQVNVSETKYAFQRYATNSLEYQALVAKNLQYVPLEQNTYSGDNGTSFPLSAPYIINSTVQPLEQETSNYRNGIYADVPRTFNTRSVNHDQGYIQNFSYFNHPGFAAAGSAFNVPEWVEAGSVPAKRDDYGNITHWETPYHAGKTVYGYNGSAITAVFAHTKGLDASYAGFEDYFEGGPAVAPVAGFGDGWGDTPLSYPNQGSFRASDAYSGAWSYRLQNGGGRSPEKQLDLYRNPHFPANQHLGMTEHLYRVGFYAKTGVNLSGSVKLIFDFGSNCQPIVQAVSMPLANAGEWTYYEKEILLPLGCGDPIFYIERTDGATPDLLIDDVVVYPKGAEYTLQSLDQHRRPTARINTANQTVKAEYDQFGRLVRTYDAAGDLLTQYTYRLTDNIPSENSYIEVAAYSSSSQVGVKRVYFDGLSRQKQEITWEPSHARAIVNGATDYDAMGRPYKVYSPVPLPNVGAGLPGRIVDDIDLRARTFYGTNHPFTETEYDQTPESRVLKQYHPRLNWQSQQFFEYGYGVNQVPIEGFGPGELLRKDTYAEDGSHFVEYIDKFGHVVMTEVPTDDGINEEPLGGVIRGGANLTRIQTTYTYDRAGRLIRTVNPEGQTIENWYASNGTTTKEQLPDRGVTEYRYDRYGRLRFMMDPEDRAHNVAVPGGICSGTSCRRIKYYRYDDLGRTTEEGVVYQSGHLFDDLTKANDGQWPGNSVPHEVKIKNTYGGPLMASRGRMVEQQVAQSHTYDVNLAQFVADQTDYYTYQYDENGRVKEQSYALGGLAGIHRFVYGYNRAGLVTQQWYENPTFSRQLYTDRWYDEWGRVKQVHSGTYDPYTKVFHDMKLDGAYSYDGVGRLYRKVLGESGDPADPHLEYLDYSYDVRNRLSLLESNRFRMELGYDIRGNVLLQRWHHEQFDTDPNSWNQYRYQFDYLDRLIAADYSLVNFASGSSGGGSGQRAAQSNFMPPTPAANGAAIYASAVDQYGGMDTMTEANVLRNPQVDIIDYTEATIEKVEAEIELGSAALGDFKVKEGADKVIYVEAKVDENLHWKTVADLEEETETEEDVAVIEPAQKYDTWYRYDRVGNINYLKRKLWDGIATSVQQINYQYTAGLPNNQLLGVSGDYASTYTYDLNGNLTSDTEKGISLIQYDWRNMPVAITKGAETLGYRYDGAGQRVYKRIESVGTGSVEEEYYLGDVVLDQSGNVKRMGTDVGYAIYDSVNQVLQRFYTITDWLGSNRVVFDEAGTTVMAADYYAYGLELGGRNYVADVESNRRKFTGHERDHELGGIDYHGARYYNAVIGRYLSVDPLQVEFAAWGSYTYVLDNPVMYVDPNGMSPVMTGGGVEVETVTITAKRPESRGFFGRLWDKTKEIGAHVGTFALGIGNAISSNALGGAGRGNPQGFGEYAGSAAAGQWVGDVLSVVGGTILMVQGGTMIGGGIAAEGTGVLSLPGAAAVGTGAGVTTLGGSMLWNGIANLKMGSGDVSMNNESKKAGKRRKNRVPDQGEPGTTQTNEPGTTSKKYGEDGWVEKEFNKGHIKDPQPEALEDHIHDWVPNPYNPSGQPNRGPARKPNPGEIEKDFPDIEIEN